MTSTLAMAENFGILDLLLKVGQILLLEHVLILLGALMVWGERRVAALMQDRVGPNRVGPAGLLQAIADLGKFIFKEDVVPGHVSKWMYVLAPTIALVPAMITFAVIPYAPGMQIADLNIGILYILSIASLGVYGITLGGWASNSKYALFGGVRASAQMISYEVCLGISAVGALLMAGTLHLGELVTWQANNGWFLFHQPLGFLIFLTSGYAETNRLPFDMPEAETELCAGYHVEYSSMKFALFFLAEYTNMIVSSALVTTLFLGGWSLFGLENLGWAMGLLIFSVKTLFLLFVYLWIRWTLPRFRYDQLMAIGWKWLFPMALVNVLATAGAQAMHLPWLRYVMPLVLIGIGIAAAAIAAKRDPGPPPLLDLPAPSPSLSR
ncbi:MAG: NADH-quinone oxidoreductase subunit NuoH [Planctomycetota bacterium]